MGKIVLLTMFFTILAVIVLLFAFIFAHVYLNSWNPGDYAGANSYGLTRSSLITNIFGIASFLTIGIIWLIGIIKVIKLKKAADPKNVN